MIFLSILGAPIRLTFILALSTHLFYHVQIAGKVTYIINWNEIFGHGQHAKMDGISCSQPTHSAIVPQAKE